MLVLVVPNYVFKGLSLLLIIIPPPLAPFALLSNHLLVFSYRGHRRQQKFVRAQRSLAGTHSSRDETAMTTAQARLPILSARVYDWEIPPLVYDILVEERLRVLVLRSALSVSSFVLKIASFSSLLLRLPCCVCWSAFQPLHSDDK